MFTAFFLIFIDLFIGYAGSSLGLHWSSLVESEAHSLAVVCRLLTVVTSSLQSMDSRAPGLP